MKKQFLLVLSMVAILICLFAISASAVTPNNDGEVFVATDGTTLALYDTDGKALAWFYDSTSSTYVPYRVGIDFTMALGSNRELVPSTAISDTDGDDSTTFPYTVSNMILMNGRDYAAFTYISGTWKDLPIQAIYVNNKFAWINKTAFNNNNTLRVFDIPKDHDVYLHIGPAFVKANALESFYVPKKAKFEGTSTFEYSTGLKYVEFHDQWEYTLQGFEFNGCTALESAKLPSTITVIPKALFRDCKSLTSIVIPSSVTKIDGEFTRSDRGAFVGCTSLKTITIPANVTFISAYAFASSGLETIVFEERTLQYDEEGNLTNGLSMEQYAVFENCKSLKELILPEGLTKIGNCFAKGCSALTKLSLPSTLSELDGSQHFYGTALTEVIGLEDTKLTYLSDSMFRGVKTWKPEVLKLPNTCTTLYSYALADIGVQNLYLGASFAKLEGNHPLTGCSSLKAIYAPVSATSLTLGNSSTQLVFVTSTDEAVISAISTSTGIAQIMTLAQYEAGEYTSGKCIITGYNKCDAFYDGHSFGELSMNFVSYLEAITFSSECTVCGETHIDAGATINPLFTCLGYSAAETGSIGGIAVGFSVDKAAIAKYVEVTGAELKYGVFVVAYKNIGENGQADIINADETGAAGVVCANVSNTKNYEFTAIEIKITGFKDDTYKDAPICMGAYVISQVGEESSVSYLQAGTPNEGGRYASTTYNAVLNNNNTSTEE
ncbi:MAG: leucine-rich repeat domain-containing protein [Ruminococcaceae bacterium]|nr:leucine-rich repeat domain-containing protein [Oscillospiraceae bacterium]